MPVTIKSGQGGVRYPWKRWLERKRPVTLVQGRDFECLPHSFAQQLRNAAYRLRYKISLVIESDRVTMSNRKK